MRTLLDTPFREVRVEVPVRMDNGALRVFAGYRVQHSGVRGPSKGGIRYHPETNVHEVRALAAAMTPPPPSTTTLLFLSFSCTDSSKLTMLSCLR